MKSKWTFFCLLLLFSLTVFGGDFEIKIDAEKDAYYNTLTGPGDGWIYLPPEAFNDNGSDTDPGPVDEIDLSANWYSAWDETYLYVYVDVFDDMVYQTGEPDYWKNDCFDAKIDPDAYVNITSEVFCFAMTCMDSADIDPSLYAGVGNIVETVGGGWIVGTDSTAYKSVTPDDYARALTENGYIVECRLKWEWVATSSKGPIYPTAGDTYGFAVSIHDNDNGASARDNSIEWAASLVDAVWTNCTYMGYMELLADHKINYVAESLVDPSIAYPDPQIYIPTITTAVSPPLAVVKNFALSQNYPNPFNPVTTISYTLERPSVVKIGIYDLRGHEVAILVNSMKPAGTHAVQFDGTDLTNGIYFYRLQAADQVITRKMMLVK
jgi:hypothetical protein